MSMTVDPEIDNAATNGPAPIAVYLYAGDQIVENVTTGYLYFQDSLGNTSHVTDSAGTLLERYTYTAFGKPFFYDAAGNLRITSYDPAGNPITTSAYGIRHLFQGQLWTQETGLNDYRNRVELPTMGVFLQPDPVGLQFEGEKLSGRSIAYYWAGKAPEKFTSTELNLYRYCGNDPVDRSDPTGLLPVPVKDDVDAASREGLLKAREIAQKSGDGFERAKSTGRDPETGKMFVGEPTEKGRGTPYGPQKVDIPGPGRGAEPESGVHAHRNNGQTDGHDKQLPPGQTGPMASNGDRRWADVLQKAIYTISENGKMIERYRPDDSGKPNAGVTERWNGQIWIPISGSR